MVFKQVNSLTSTDKENQPPSCVLYNKDINGNSWGKLYVLAGKSSKRNYCFPARVG
jgi:hypothetical protein